MSMIKWTKARRTMLEEIEIREIVHKLRMDNTKVISQATLKKVVAEYIKQAKAPAKPDDRKVNPRYTSIPEPGYEYFSLDDSKKILDRIAEEAMQKARQ